ncbi:MAG: dienelactone hydrolase family protein [Pseudomonadota bacterium]
MAISSQEIQYTVNGEPFVGYYAFDDSQSGPRPGVLVVHEWWGHNDYVRQRAEQLAGEGFAALAVDMYGAGRSGSTPDEAGALMNAAMGTPGAIEARFDAAQATLCEQAEVDAGHVSAIGYCFGGAVVLNMARAGKSLDVVSSFHGLLETENPLNTGAFAGHIAVFNGADDPMVSAEILAGFEQEMEAASATYTLKSYPGVVHGFTNPEATARGEKYGMPLKYDESADKESHATTIDLIRASAG